MTFDYPWLLTLAAVLPIVVAGLVIRAARSRGARFERWAANGMVQRLVPASALISGVTGRAIRLGAAAAFVGVAIAGPRWGSGSEVVRSQGIDIVLALDASLSMLATDARPTRLAQMKDEVRRLREMSPGDRIGLIAFAGRAYVLSPLTVDAGALDLFLDNLDPSVVGEGGSSMAAAIRQGVDLLSLSNSGADKALVLMSDGEAFESEDDIVTEAKRAGGSHIAVVTVGFGTTDGSTIPLHDVDGTTLKKDQDGNTVITKYTPEFLSAAAKAAGGTFIEAGATDKAGRVKTALANLRSQSRFSRAADTGVPRFQWFVIPALLLVLFDTWLTDRRRAKRIVVSGASARTVAAAATAVAASGCFLAHDTAPVKAYKQRDFLGAASQFRQAIANGDQSIATSYNLGTSLIGADSLTPATTSLEPLTQATDSTVRYRSLFNYGLAQLEQALRADSGGGVEQRAAALAAYKKILLANPADTDAIWNYELALKGSSGGGGGGAKPNPQSPSPAPSPTPQRKSGIDPNRAEQLLSSAEREERETQAKKQKQNRSQPPLNGKDW